MAFEKVLPILILAGALGLAGECGEASAHEYGPDVVAVARLAVNEASFSPSDDATAIALVVSRNARRAGLSPAAYVERYHRRIGSTRAWVAELDASFERPASWPESAVPWDEVGREKWARVLANVDAALAGRARIRCEASTWGSPVVDAERLARMTAAGWELVPCGATRNVFVRRSRRD